VYRVLPDVSFVLDVIVAVATGTVGAVVYYDVEDDFVAGGGVPDELGSVIGTMPELGLVFAGIVQDREICGNACDDDADGNVDCADDECIVECGGCLTDGDCDPDQICLANNCVPAPDLCAGVTCDVPPAPSCLDDLAVSYFGEGRCESGLCVDFGATFEDCRAIGQICRSGFCVDDTGDCAGVDCSEPPDDFCTGEILTSYTGGGTCIDGACAAFPSTTSDCRGVGRSCDMNRCAGDACVDGVCTDPPSGYCDGNVAMGYAMPNGLCAPDGECAYFASVTENCAESGAICRDGRCLPDPCDGIFCGRFEMPYCEGDTRVLPLPDGVCYEGDCVYFDERTDCAASGLVCESGRCV
jgi:hypothetical protein